MIGRFQRIGFVSTRFAGTDGVSFEAGKWARIFEAWGAECFWFAGQLETPPERSWLAPEAFFNDAEVLEIQAGLFGVVERTTETERRALALAERLSAELRRFVERFRIDLLVVENALAIPMHVPLGLAIEAVLRETGISALAHHHDFAWERERFATNACADWLEKAFPPRLSGVAHVVINSMQREALMERCGLEAVVIPNVLDFEVRPPVPDDYARSFRAEIDVCEDELLVLQPTRIVARKGIEHSIELVRRLSAERPAVLVLSHPAGDEGYDYLHEIETRIEAAKIRAVFLTNRIGQRRSVGEDGARIFTLADAYPHADLVTYPSSWEGFGNALLEAVYFGRPVLVNRYPVYRSDIASRGLRAVEMDGAVTDEVVAQVRRVLDDPLLRAQWAAENIEVGRKYFSLGLLRDRLAHILGALATAVEAP